MASTSRIFLKDIVSEYEKDVVRALKKLGHEAVLQAYAEKGFTNRSHNLHDSYGSAVYLRGAIVGSSVQYLENPISSKKDKKTGKTGRQTVRDYLHSHSFGASNQEIVLVVVAAMYYAGILEAGGMKRVKTGNKSGPKTKKVATSRGPGDKFKVISPARAFITKRISGVIDAVNKKYGLKDMPIPKTRVIRGE